MGKITKLKRSEIIDGYLFILPAMIIVSIFVVYPAINLFIMSINDYKYINGVFTSFFVGLENYIMAFDDSLFIKSLMTSFKFPFIITPIQTALALFVAALLSGKVKCIGFFRTIYFIPVVMSFVVVAMFWKIMLNTNFGVINEVLVYFGLERMPFLTSPKMAIYSVVLVSIWKSWGWYMIIFLSAINEVPREIYESSGLDGASSIQQFFYITLPNIRGAMLFVIVISTMNTIKLFTPIMVMTDGGPVNSTAVIVHLIWITAFKNNNFGYAAAMAVMLFLIILVISVVQYKCMRAED